MEKLPRHKTPEYKEYMKAWRAKNAKHVKAYMVEYRRKYRAEHLAELKQRDKDYYVKNAERIKEYERRRYQENRNDRLETSRQYREKNQDVISVKQHEGYVRRKQTRTPQDVERQRAASRKWHSSPQGRAYMKRYYEKRYSTDDSWRTQLVLRSRIKTAFRRSGAPKSVKTIELLGCTPDEAKRHIESQFRKGMTWDNYGEWHIDHIVPVKHFDITKEEEQRKAFHYTNLQPLWAHENLHKQGRLMTPYTVE